MKQIRLLFTSAVIVFYCSCQSSGDAKESSAPMPDTKAKDSMARIPEPDSATKMQNMMNYGAVGPMQKMLASWNGKWDAEIKMIMGPDVPPMLMNTLSENTMINGGLIQQSTHNGNFNGMPFAGVSQTGYDNHRNIFWSTWYDNFSSGLTYMEGTMDTTAHVIHLSGTMTDPETKAVIPVREEFKVGNPNEQILEQYYTRKGTETLGMVITFRRKK